MASAPRSALGATWLAFGDGAASVGSTATTDTYARITASDGILTLSSNSADPVLLKGLAPPVDASDAATKNYVDGARAGIFMYDPVDYSTGANLPDKSGKSGSDTTITLALSTTPSTITVAGTNVGHTFDELFNASNAMSSGSITLALNMTFLIRHDCGSGYTGVDPPANKKIGGIWEATAVTSQNSFVLTRRADFKYGHQVRSGGYVFVKSGAAAGQGFVISNPIERTLTVSGTRVTVAASAAAGTTSVTLSADPGNNVSGSVDYESATFSATSVGIKEGQAVIINHKYYRVDDDCTTTTLTLASDTPLLESITSGMHIEIGLNLLGTDADDSATSVSNIPQSNSAYTITWTQFSGGGGGSYSGTTNQITLTGSTFSIADAFNKNNFTSFAATASGSINWTMGASVADAFKVDALGVSYLKCDTSQKTVTIGAATADGITTIQAGNSGTSAALNIVGTGLTTGKFNVTLTDDRADAFTIKEGSTSYMTITTTNSAELITFGKDCYAPTFYATSDVRLKRNIQTVADPLDMIERMRGVTWDWRADDRQSCGVIAQELKQVLPCAVGGTDDQMSVNYTALTGVFIEAIKRLKAKIDELEASNSASEKSRDMLHAALAKLKDQHADAEDAAMEGRKIVARSQPIRKASGYNLRRRD
jgi:hypothetical protein